MEYNGTRRTAVFDITTGVPATRTPASYIPLTINADSGTINFATPALLDPATDPLQARMGLHADVVNGSVTVDS